MIDKVLGGYEPVDCSFKEDVKEYLELLERKGVKVVKYRAGYILKEEDVKFFDRVNVDSRIFNEYGKYIEEKREELQNQGVLVDLNVVLLTLEPAFIKDGEVIRKGKILTG